MPNFNIAQRQITYQILFIGVENGGTKELVNYFWKKHALGIYEMMNDPGSRCGGGDWSFPVEPYTSTYQQHLNRIELEVLFRIYGVYYHLNDDNKLILPEHIDADGLVFVLDNRPQNLPYHLQNLEHFKKLLPKLRGNRLKVKLPVTALWIMWDEEDGLKEEEILQKFNIPDFNSPRFITKPQEDEVTCDWERMHRFYLGESEMHQPFIYKFPDQGADNAFYHVCRELIKSDDEPPKSK